MAPARIEDLLGQANLTMLQGHRRGWCFCVERPDATADTTAVSIWGIDDQGEVARLVADGSAPACAEDGSGVAYFASIDGSREVFLLDTHSGATRRVTRLDGSITSVEQFDSAGGRLLVRRTFNVVAGDDQTPLAVEFLPVTRDGKGMEGRQAVRLGTVDVATGTYSGVVDDGGDVVEAQWSPGAEELAYIQRWSGRQRHGMDLWLRGDDGSTRQLTDSLPSISCLCWSPDARMIALAASTLEGDSLTWLHVVDVRSGAIRRFEVELGTPSTLQWDADGKRLLGVEARAGLQRLVMVSLEDGSQQVLHERAAAHVLETAARGTSIAFIVADPNEGPEVWRCGAQGEAPRRLTTFNGWREQRRPMRVSRRRFLVPDGEGGQERIDGWLLLPAGDGPFPLLLDMHGGPQVPATPTFDKHPHWPVLVEKGWAILALNAVGSSSYGADFARRLRGRWGELDWPQWQAAAAQLREEGTASQELAVFGHSYGGYLAAWALVQDPTLTCVVVSGGISNLESHAGTSDSGYYVSPYAMAGELPERRARYRELSPITHVRQAAAPTLILQGTADHRCPIGQAEELFSSLLRNTPVAARLVRFPDGSHHLSTTGKPSFRVTYHKELVAWLEQWRHHARGEQLLAGPGQTDTEDAQAFETA